MKVNPPKLICFDCDSTLSAIEGVDELARACGPEAFAQVEAMTNDAMDGRMTLESVFGRRLEIIRPGRADVTAIGRRCLETIEPTAQAPVAALVARGWTPVIVSGGFRQVIQPLAAALGIERIEAVDLFFDTEGRYRGYDENFPTTRSGGKRETIVRLKREWSPVQTVMVGDGVSDLETKPVVDRFIGFGRYVRRDIVRQSADVFIASLDELVSLLKAGDRMVSP
jgi:phosphoserine phosphatase